MVVTLLLMWRRFVDTLEFIWHIWNLNGTDASLTSCLSCLEFCSRPTELVHALQSHQSNQPCFGSQTWLVTLRLLTGIQFELSLTP